MVVSTVINVLFRSSHQRCSGTKGVHRSFTKFTGKHLCQSIFFNKVKGLRPATLLEKRLWHRCLLVNFAKFLRTSFLQNTSGQLLLNFAEHLSVASFSMQKIILRKIIDFAKKLRSGYTLYGYHCFLDNRDTFVLLINFGSN